MTWLDRDNSLLARKSYLPLRGTRAEKEYHGYWPHAEWWKGFIMNDKILIIAIFSLLGIGILSVLYIAVPWLVNYALLNWRDSLLDSGIVMIAIGLFVYGFYMNTRMH